MQPHRSSPEDVLLAVIAHRPGLFADPGLADEVASAGRLALENERLHAELRARSWRSCGRRALESSRLAAIERRRLERDLHDGVQQRLQTLSLAVGLIAEHGDDSKLARAQQELRLLLAGSASSRTASTPWRWPRRTRAAVEALAEQSRSLSGSGADSRRSGSMRRSKRPHTWSSARWPATRRAGPPSTRIARATGWCSKRR